MRIGSIELENITVMAPLAGITHLPFRLLVKEQGCALVCSEMISANGLVHASAKTHRMLASCAEEKPLSVQIFGSDPDIMAKAAALVQTSGADILDINFGCWVKKVVKIGAGVALMKEPRKAERILNAVRKAVTIPLSIKIRSGWDRSGSQALEMAQIAEACGVDALAIHPRTASQGLGGQADWGIIAAVKKRISIPVIGNGDIAAPIDAVNMMADTRCDAVMIGRAAIGNPWIFAQIHACLQGRAVEEVSLSMRFNAMARYIEVICSYMDETHACRMLRSRLGWYTKGLAHSAKFRESIKRIATRKEALAKIRAYEAQLR